MSSAGGNAARGEGEDPSWAAPVRNRDDAAVESVTLGGMHPGAAERVLAGLERACKERPSAEAAERLLGEAERTFFPDGADLVRLHESLLFLRAYPHSTAVLRGSERLLRSFGVRVQGLARAGADLSPLFEREVSGIARTTVEMPFSYDQALWLSASFPGRLRITWDDEGGGDLLGAALARFIPLAADEALVEANVDGERWVEAARGRRRDAYEWLLARFEALPGSAREKAERFDALGLWAVWDLRDGWATRTRMRREWRKPFADDGPLLSRRDVSIDEELSAAPLPVRTLSRREGKAALDLCRAAMATRYRELYAFTHGDPESIASADCGRGLEILVVGIVPERRLPLRAGYGVAFFRNGVPVGYGDAYGVLGRLAVSLNIFPAFRDGESAYVWVRLLRLYRHLLGASVFTVDPYQIGLGNDEAIETGAFWFYRKLGFRSADARLEGLAAREDGRVASRPGYRTGPRTLRRLAGAALVRGGTRADDRFHVRNLGLAAARRMAASGKEPEAWRRETVIRMAGAVGLDLGEAGPEVLRAFAGLAPALDLVPGLDRWSEEEKSLVLDAVRAKAGGPEQRYLAALSRLPLLETALLRAGSVG